MADKKDRPSAEVEQRHDHDDHGASAHQEHGRGHDDHEDQGHDHVHRDGIIGWLQSLLHLGGHSHAEQSLIADDEFIAGDEGIRTVWIALGLLLLTTVLQVVIYLFSGSVALLADTVHNLGDGLNSVPLLIAFYLARRAPTRRYNYGMHRAEDVAGVVIVLSIAFSAGYIFWESARKFVEPEPIRNLGAVALAALIGFIGNELVAIIQIRTGKRIGSAALVADGQHARTDGLTSLAVLLAAGGAALGFPLADPIVGLLIGVTVVFITWDAIKSVWFRLMDAIEPEIYAEAVAAADDQVGHHDGLESIERLRLRWLGHRLTADVVIAVTPSLSVTAGHDLAEQVRLGLFKALPLLSEAVVHVEPHGADDHHAQTRDREPVPRRIE